MKIWLKKRTMENKYLRQDCFSNKNVSYESVLAFLKEQRDPLIVAKDILFFIEADKNYPKVFIGAFKFFGITTIPISLIVSLYATTNIINLQGLIICLAIISLLFMLLKLASIYKTYTYVTLIINDIISNEALLKMDSIDKVSKKEITVPALSHNEITGDKRKIEYEFSAKEEKWGEINQEVYKVRMIYDGVPAGRKAPSFPNTPSGKQELKSLCNGILRIIDSTK